MYDVDISGRLKLKEGGIMKVWELTKVIEAPIETIWKVIDGSEENLKKLDPKIVNQDTILETEERIGSKYLQTYREGKREETYEVVVTDYFETDDEKMFAIAFTIANMFEVGVYYKLKKISEQETEVYYKTTNNPLKFFAKLMMFIMPGGNKVLIDHLAKIEQLAKEMEK